jgi:purine-nucleoside phosphorylase
MPNQPKTPQRAVRISDEVWTAAMSKAEERGETVSDVIRRALIAYGKRK